VGFAHLGVPRAGAADRLSLRQANRLVGNADDCAPALECTLRGPVLRFDVATLIALTGGVLDAELDGRPVPMYQSVPVAAGQTLVCGTLKHGARSYLAIHGGIKVTPVLGSASTDTLSGLGPPKLCKHDALEIDAATPNVGFYLRAAPTLRENVVLRIVPGPHDDLFSPATMADLLSRCFSVSQQSDRTGIRLNETLNIPKPLSELPSQGMVTGAIQVPGGGRPVVLLPNHGTTGGYPVIATVIAADQSLLGQLGTGSRISFERVTREQAVTALREQERRLQRDVIEADTSLLIARALLMLARANPELRELQVRESSGRVRLRR
jgi:biotin-dependent carboxylase-like uncharacterized protein